jgi:predicted N-acetyltransferase YhbS
MSVVVRRASADEVRELRLSVLRPQAERTPSAYDLDPATVHIGAFDGERVVGCASFFPDPYDDEPLAWRLRGMAVDPGCQGMGIGRLVLEAGTAAAEEAGAPLLWANGRVSALGFYETCGWRAVGDVFDYGPGSVPHRVILRSLSPASSL